MKESIRLKQVNRIRRAKRVRMKLRGTQMRPRMTVHISRQHLYVQFTDDQKGQTLFTVSDALIKKGIRHVTKDIAFELGKKCAELARGKGVTTVTFDRGSRAYHGRIESVANGAREGGLIF